MTPAHYDNCCRFQLTLGEKVAFLSRPGSYPHEVEEVAVKETHMSWVFLVGERVYKLKKPIRSTSQDFSTIERRMTACRTELLLNRRLAKQTYLDVIPLTISNNGLAINGSGAVVDWLVVMRRLNERLMLDDLILKNRLTISDANRLAGILHEFYCHARPSQIDCSQHIDEWQNGLLYNRRILLDPVLNIPGGLIRKIDKIQRDFLAGYKDFVVQRSRRGFIVDAHGDLRPEHIWLGMPLQIIDCLDFNKRLRTLDILSEIAFLDLECERLGAAWAGKHIRKRLVRRRPPLNDEVLFRFYRSYHAMVRARLAIAHLLERQPREPEKWRPLTLSYLHLAYLDTRKLQVFD